jgi:hypothetical protein
LYSYMVKNKKVKFILLAFPIKKMFITP